MVITEKLLAPGAEHGRPGTKLIPQGIVIHYVGNPGSSALANRNYFENTGIASAHYIIGISGETIRIIPDNETAWHAGRSYGLEWDEIAKTNNSKFLGIECCHPDPGGKFSGRTYKALIELCTELCRIYGFEPLQDIYRHYDVSGKLCPLYFVNNPDVWGQFKHDVANAARVKADNPSGWAALAWDWVKSYALNDGTRPRDTATREEVAAIVYRFFRTFC